VLAQQQASLRAHRVGLSRAQWLQQRKQQQRLQPLPPRLLLEQTVQQHSTACAPTSVLELFWVHLL
jgi:hypothetical protein